LRDFSHPVTTPEADTPSGLNENPGVSRGYVAACHQVALPSHVEAPGIEPAAPTPQGKASTPVTASPSFPLAHSLAHDSQKCPEIDADLARLIAAWPTLPEAMRAGILAMVEAARQKS
jgi:hypothetical protein